MMFEKCSNCQCEDWIFRPSEIFGNYIIALVCPKCNNIVNYKARLAVCEGDDDE